MSDDRLYLSYILECISDIEELATGGREAFEANRHRRAAILYYLQTMAESTQRLSDASKNAHTEIDWLGISGFRNRLVHGYLGVDLAVVWRVIEHDLPELKTAAQALLETLDAARDEQSDP